MNIETWLKEFKHTWDRKEFFPELMLQAMANDAYAMGRESGIEEERARCSEFVKLQAGKDEMVDEFQRIAHEIKHSKHERRGK